MKKCVVWCCNSDIKAKEWLAHSMMSFIKHDGENVDKFILTDDVSMKSERAKVIHIGDLVKKHNLTEVLKFKWQGRQASPMMMGRLLIPFLDELKDYDKVLYLDIDTDIIDDAFQWIFDIDLAGYDVGMAQELRPSEGSIRNHPKARHCRLFVWANDVGRYTKENYKRLEKGTYFNSGVLLMNMPELRKTFESIEFVCHVAIDALCAKLKLMDQDVINSMCRIKRINSAFNCFVCTHDTGDFVFCLHNAGGAKIEAKEYPVLKREDFV